MTTMKKFALLTTIGLLACAQSGYAANSTWLGASLDQWNKSGNWSNGIPGAGDVAIFSNADTVTFTTNIPTSLAEIRVTNASAAITLQPGSTATLTVPVVTVSAGSLKFDTRQQTSVSSSISLSNGASLIVDAAMTNTGTISLANTADMSVNAALTNSGTITLANTATMSVNAASSNSGAITVPSGTTFSVNAALSNSAAMSITGIFDAVADVTNSSNPTLTINSGGVVKFRNDADLLGTATLDNNGLFDAIDGETELSSNITIATTCTGEFRVELVSSGTPRLKFDGTYTSHAFSVRVSDTSSKVNVAHASGISISGSYYSAYSPPCGGKMGAGTFAWTGTGGASPTNCP